MTAEIQIKKYGEKINEEGGKRQKHTSKAWVRHDT